MLQRQAWKREAGVGEPSRRVRGADEAPFSPLAQVPHSSSRVIAIVQPAKSSTPSAGSYAFTPRRVRRRPDTEKPAICEMRRCSSSRRGVLSPKCSDRVNSPRLIEWRDERIARGHSNWCRDSSTLSKSGLEHGSGRSEALGEWKLELSVIPSRGASSASHAQSRVSCARSAVSIVSANLDQLPRERVREARQRIGQGYLGYPNCEGLPRWRGAPEPFVLLLAYSVSPERTPPVAHEAPSGGRGWRPRKGSSRQCGRWEREERRVAMPPRLTGLEGPETGTVRENDRKVRQVPHRYHRVSPASRVSTALGGRSHEEVYGMLAAMAERAPKQGRAGRVA